MTVNHLKRQISDPLNTSTNRQDLTCGIVHIGVGNFHRAHQQYYTNKLVIDPSQRAWGICGVALLPSDEPLVRALQGQEGRYSLTTCSASGKYELHHIESLKEIIWGIEDPQKVIDKIASPDTKIISLTITEGGYNMASKDGDFKFDDPKIQSELKNRTKPQSVFGFIAAGLRQRMKAGTSGVTILSCDNLQHNGDTAKKAFSSFIQAQDSDLALWLAENVTFPNSMVDRITPTTNAEDIIWLNKKNQIQDQAPVYCEDYVQWVIEDNFIAGRPEWEKVGVQFTDDVTAFEHMKLSLLNASHTMLSYPAFLAGYRKVDEAMENQYLYRYLSDFMNIDITPYVPAPDNTDLNQYKSTLLERFANRSVSDQVSRLCFDGISKFPVYILPNLEHMLNDGKDLKRAAFGIAAYRHYLKYKRDDNGESYDIAEPWLTQSDLAFIESEDPTQFLRFKPFHNTALHIHGSFVSLYQFYCGAIKKHGAMQVLKTIL